MTITRKCERIRFKKGKQSEFLRRASKPFGSLRKFAKFLDMGWGYFWYYISEQVTLPGVVFDKSLPFTGLSKKFILNNWVIEILPYNWFAIKGGVSTGKINSERLKNDMKFRRMWVERSKKAGSKLKGRFIENWDVGFRKAGKRKVTGPKGEKMFNENEKDIALMLLSKNKNYEYEKLINLNGKFYFPDFIVGKTIIERCGLSTNNYLDSLKNKITDYTNCWDGKIIIVCPKHLFGKMKGLIPQNSKINLITEDKLDIMASVA